MDWGDVQHYVMPILSDMEYHMNHMRTINVKPKFECWGAGSFHNIQWLADRGCIDAPYWLGVSIDAEAELEPRVEFTAAAYALNADKLDGLDATAFAPAVHTHALDNLSDVEIVDPAEGEVLTFKSGSWKSCKGD